MVSARIIPTDHFDVPPQDAIQPTQDMVSEAFQKRPEIEQSQIGLEDARINMLGTKNNLLPSLSVFANLSNNGLAGGVNTLPVPVTVGGATGQIPSVIRTRTPADVNGFFLGGYGTFLNQLFSRNFPNYSAGFQLNVPIRNRANQADLITDELNYRQSQIQDKQLQNNIKLNVINAQIALKQARAAYETAVAGPQTPGAGAGRRKAQVRVGHVEHPQRGHRAARHHHPRDSPKWTRAASTSRRATRSITSSAGRSRSRTWTSARPRTASSRANPT